MKYAVNLLIAGPLGDPHSLAELARIAEEAGWDGVFLEDYIVHHMAPGRIPVFDPRLKASPLHRPVMTSSASSSIASRALTSVISPTRAKPGSLTSPAREQVGGGPIRIE